MNGSVFADDTREASELAELRRRIGALELRLDRIERGSPVSASELAPQSEELKSSTAAGISTDIAAATIFTRVAMLCFVLVGALILRVLTQQNVLGAGFGTMLGFLYAAHLIVLSLIPGRFGGFARENSVFQCSGAALGFFIGIESAMRTQTLGRGSALLIIAAFGLAALGMAMHDRKMALGATGVIGGILALVALDLVQATAALQLALIIMLAATGVANSSRERWHWLRPFLTLLVMVLLSVGFFIGKEPGIDRSLLIASAAVWLGVMLQHLASFRQLGRAAAWLPIVTIWFAALQQLAHWPATGVTNAVIAVFALACVIVSVRRGTEFIPAVIGLIATTAFAAAIGCAILDHTGLSCAVAAMALWFAGRRAAPDAAAIFATFLVAVAALIGLAQLLLPPVPPYGLLAMAGSAGILVFHYIRNGRTGTGPYLGLASRLAPIALAAGLTLLLGLFWELLNRLFRDSAQLLLTQTAVVVLTALVLTFWGHAARRRSPLFCGLACMVLVLGKLVVVDLVRLKSVYMLTSVVLVALASVAISVILRRNAGPGTERNEPVSS